MVRATGWITRLSPENDLELGRSENVKSLYIIDKYGDPDGNGVKDAGMQKCHPALHIGVECARKREVTVGKPCRGPSERVGNLHSGADKYDLWGKPLGFKLRHNKVWDLGTLKYCPGGG